MLRSLGIAFVKDLRLLVRDRAALIFLTIAPILVITVAGFSLASLYGADPRGSTGYLLPLVDEDGGDIGRAIRERLATETAVELRNASDREEALGLLRDREAGVALIIPAGASEAVAAGRDAELLLYTDPVKYLEIANVRALIQELRHGLESAARDRVARRLEKEKQEAATRHEEIARKEGGLREVAPPPIALPGDIELRETSVTGAPARLNTFDQNVPGFSVTFLLLGMLLGVSLGLLDERDWGTFARLRAMPAPLSATLIAKLSARFVVGVMQMVILFVVGWIAFDVSLGPEPWALLLPIGGIVFAGTAFGLVVAGLARSREAVLPLGSIVIVTMAAVGGCWWPIDLEPRWMRSVALAFPTTWAMAAFNDLMIRRQTLEAAIRPAAVLFAFGGFYLAVGLSLFRRKRPFP